MMYQRALHNILLLRAVAFPVGQDAGQVLDCVSPNNPPLRPHPTHPPASGTDHRLRGLSARFQPARHALRPRDTKRTPVPLLDTRRAVLPSNMASRSPLISRILLGRSDACRRLLKRPRQPTRPRSPSTARRPPALCRLPKHRHAAYTDRCVPARAHTVVQQTMAPSAVSQMPCPLGIPTAVATRAYRACAALRPGPIESVDFHRKNAHYKSRNLLAGQVAAWTERGVPLEPFVILNSRIF